MFSEKSELMLFSKYMIAQGWTQAPYSVKVLDVQKIMRALHCLCYFWFDAFKFSIKKTHYFKKKSTLNSSYPSLLYKSYSRNTMEGRK